MKIIKSALEQFKDDKRRALAIAGHLMHFVDLSYYDKEIIKRSLIMFALQDEQKQNCLVVGIEQNQLELAHMGLVIARMQLKCMSVCARAVESHDAAEGFEKIELEMSELAEAIFKGEIIGTDAGRA